MIMAQLFMIDRNSGMAIELWAQPLLLKWTQPP